MLNRRIEQKLLSFVPDKLFLQAKYLYRIGKPLNLKSPQTFNEKLQWLKLYYHRPEMTRMVDKVEAKKIVASIVGEQYIIPTFGVYNNVDEIDWDALPNQFVLKCTHDSGGVVICKDKSAFDKESAKRKLRNGLSHTYYYSNREWPYKNVTPRIICEAYMEDESGYELKDYKWFCFDGVPKALFVASDRYVKDVETKFDFFDTDFNHLPFTNGHPNSEQEIRKPDGFEEMKRIAALLSAGFPHVRVDLYDINGRTCHLCRTVRL